MSDKKKITGRPTLYKEEYIDLAYKYVLLGADNETLAKYFEVNIDTIYEWKKRHPLFSDALKKGKAIADAKVAESLYNRACGFKIKKVKHATFNGAITDREEYEEEVAPDPTAMIFWLKNRQPKMWRDKREVSTKQQVTIDTKDIKKLSTDQLQEAIDSELN